MTDELARCKHQLKTLEEENRHLKEAASTFGSLAERLSGQLREERRRADRERRTEARGIDRRGVSDANAPGDG